MPELPEVEAARRAIEENCLGKRIKKSTVADDPKVIDGVSPSDFEASIVGKRIVAAHRKGKNMWLQLDSPPFPSFQFGMAGAVYIKGVAVTKYKRSAVKDTDEWPSKYSKFFVELDDGLEFSFTDKRRFAKVRLLDNPVSAPPISDLGPDALLEPMTVDEFWNSLSKKKIGIKALLLDQSFISGIGNWMADEVLYQARIHPQQSVSSMSKETCSTLVKCISEVTNSAVGFDADSLRFPVDWLFHFRWGKKPGNVNGKMFLPYIANLTPKVSFTQVIKNSVEVGADSSQFPNNWIFHSRDKKPGKAFVDGKKIEFITAGGRTTAYVPELQKLCGDLSVSEAGKRSKGTNHGNPDDDVEKSGNDDESTDSKAVKRTKISRAKKLSKKLSSTAENSDDANDKYSNETSTANKHPKKKSSPSVDDLVDNREVDDKSFKKTSKAKKPSNKKLSPKVEGLNSYESDGDTVDRSKKTRGTKNPTIPRRTNKDDEDGENQRKLTRGKNSAKRKQEESNDEVSSCSESSDDYGDKVNEELNRKQRKGASSAKKMVTPSQNRKQQRIRAR
ncbi:formamidopyrimidine-DNA glycosylase isoform X2 [Henckelia pumila]|uniref:formamidopyrimidine-DNA glycosylase isoform X2 n=1 Tax=Henckelia pumila TaxID=405737 RepID=UPI003C6E1A93